MLKPNHALAFATTRRLPLLLAACLWTVLNVSADPPVRNPSIGSIGSIKSVETKCAGGHCPPPVPNITDACDCEVTFNGPRVRQAEGCSPFWIVSDCSRSIIAYCIISTCGTDGFPGTGVENYDIQHNFSSANSITWDLVGNSTVTMEITFEGDVASFEYGQVTVTFIGETGTRTGTVLVISDQYYQKNKCSFIACYEEPPPPGGGTTTIDDTLFAGSIAMNVRLGRVAFGKPAGAITMKEEAPSALLSTPACLKYPWDPQLAGVQVITNATGVLLQVRATECIVDIEEVDDYEYNIRVYQTNNITGTNGDGTYVISGNPIKTINVHNPDEATATNRLTMIVDNIYTNDFEWQTNGWELIAGGGMRRQCQLDTFTNNTQLALWEVRNAADQVVFCQTNTLATNGGVLKLVERVTGVGQAARTDTYEYYSGGEHDGLLRQMNRADGYWEIYEYTNGLVWTKYAAFQNQEPTTNALLCRTFTYEYGSNVVAGSGDKGTRSPTEARCVIEKLLGQEIGRHYVVNKRGYREDRVCVTPEAVWSNSVNLVTTTVWFTNGTDLGRAKSRQLPDGTMQLYQYAIIDGFRTNITFVGYAPYGTNVTDGVKTIEVLGMAGRPVETTTIDIASGNVIGSTAYSEYDAFNRPRKRTHTDGTATWREYGCCGPISKTNRVGTITEYFLDGLGRTTAKRRNGITKTNVLDANGAVLQTIRIGTNGNQIAQAGYSYDSGGRVLATTNAAEEVTLFTEYITNDYRMRITTYPDGSTREETYFRDGSLAQVGGTATHPMRYVHGIMDDGGTWRVYSAEIKLDGKGADTGEAVTNLFDMVGRGYKTIYGDGSFRETVYNTKGQRELEIDPDGVVTSYQYNNRGEVEYVATDMDRNHEIDFGDTAGDNDRVHGTATAFTVKEGKVVQQVKSYAWLSFDSSYSNLVSVQERSVDGLSSWSSSNGLTNRTDTHYPSTPDGHHYVTNTAPDGSYTVSHYLHNLLQDVTRKDGNNNPLSSTTYTYDQHGRLLGGTDARTGTTTFGYDDAGRRKSITTPAPGTGQGAQTTSYTFDEMGRITATTYADGTVMANEYHVTGELKKTTGSRTYPVEYKYDAQGRMTNMITWQNYSGNGGKATTLWQYHGKRGWMTNKVYEGQSTSVGYTYTPAGRLRTRTWERGITTTYTTNAAGDTIWITYSDGTTPGVTNHLDRVGRPTNILDAAGSRYFRYSDAGLLLSETNASGILAGLWFTNAYDNLQRRTSQYFFTNSGSAVFTHSYGYDQASRLTNVCDGTYSAGYSYLANSPLVDHIIYWENTTTRMTRTNQYDKLNRLLDVSFHPSAGGEKTIRASYTYNKANQRIRHADTDGTYWLYDYDELGQLISGKRYWADGTLVAGQQFEYQFDDIGNRQAAKAGGNSSGVGLRESDYSVNSLNQYTSRTVPAAADIMGIAHAEASVTVNGQSPYRKGEYYRHELSLDNSAAPVYAAVTNRADMDSISNTNIGHIFLPKTAEVFTYDADGNLTSDGRWTNRWDAENRLISMETLSSVPNAAKKKLALTYDHQGRRVSKVVSNWTGSAWSLAYERQFVYDGWNMIAELDGDNGVIRSYLWGKDLSGSAQGAGGVGGLLAMDDADEGTHFVCYDGNGNVTVLVDGNDGTLSTRYEYDPGGRTTRATGTMDDRNPYRFSTKYADDESGWLYYGYRYYNPETGRWPNRDPITEGGGKNIYSRMGNDVVGYVDLLGMIVVGFYGADSPATFPLEGNMKMQEIGVKVSAATGQYGKGGYQGGGDMALFRSTAVGYASPCAKSNCYPRGRFVVPKGVLPDGCVVFWFLSSVSW